MDLSKLTLEEIKTIAAAMYNPVKICNAYLPSKIHNDIIRRANPNWSEESLARTAHMYDESFFDQASEIEKKCRYETKEAKFRSRGGWYETKCLSDVRLGGKKIIHERGSSLEDSLQRAKNAVLYLIENDLFLISGKSKHEVLVNRHICFATRYFYDDKVNINDYIDSWHVESFGFHIHDFLGITQEEYAMFVEKGFDNLKEVLKEK